MKALSLARFKSAVAFLSLMMAATAVSAQQSANCSEIARDVSAAVEKDPGKVLMVVEDALVINEGCAGEIVKAAIVASKADSAMAGQIVQTAISVAPKMTVAINDAAASVSPGLAAVQPPLDETVIAPDTGDDKNPGKNPGKNPIAPAAPVVTEEDFFVPSTIRGVYLIQPPPTGPLPYDDTRRCLCNPVSPAVAAP